MEGNPDCPSIAIVTPVEGRTEEVAAMVASCARARAAYHGPCDHILVDSSGAATADKIKATADTFSAIYIHSETPNVRMKRNRAARSTQAELLLFLDSDLIVGENCIAQHVSALAGEVPGTVGYVDFTGKATVWNRLMEASPFTEAFRAARDGAQLPWAPTANLLVRRACFDAVGGFEERWPAKLGGDDLDLTLRITKKFGPLAGAPRAGCLHQRTTWGTRRAALGRTFRWGRMEWHLMKRHPENAVVAPLKFSIMACVTLLVLVVLLRHALLMAGIFWLGWGILSLFLFQVFLGCEGIEGLKKPFSTCGSATTAILFEVGCVFESLCNRSLLGLTHCLLADVRALNTHERMSAANIRANLGALLVIWLAAHFVG